MKLAFAVTRTHGGGLLRATLTLGDQLLSSASNFTLGVLIARTGGPDALGAFSIAFFAWLAIMGANRALVAEPMIVVGQSEGSEPGPDRGLSATLLVGGVAAAGLVLVVGVLRLLGVPFVALLALAPWIPSLLAQDYVRWRAFRLQRPQQALISDLVFVAGQATATFWLFALDQRSVATFIATWGFGATAGAIAGLAGCGTRRLAPRAGAAHLRELWSRSRWLMAEFAASFVANQGYLVLLPVLLSTSELGLFRAGSSLITPIALLFTVTLSVGLPESVRRLRVEGPSAVRRHAFKLTAAVVTLTAVYCGSIALLARTLLPLTYGPEFAGASIITTLTAISYVISSLYVGYCVALKTMQQLRRLWILRVVSAAASIAATVLLAQSWGLVGAGYASILGASVYATGALILYRRTFIRHKSSPTRSSLRGADMKE